MSLIVLLLAGMLLIVGCGGDGAESDDAGTSAIQEELSHAALDSLALSGAEAEIVKTLVQSWRGRSNLMSASQAATAAGVDITDSMRIELLAAFERYPDLSPRLKRYKPYTVILSNEEKELAQYMINYERAQATFPIVDSIAVATGMSKEEVGERLQFLGKIGFLFNLGGPDEYNQLGYSFGEKMGEFTYDTGLRYHEFEVDGREPFNVCCAKEAFFKVLREFGDKHVRYTTFDPHSLEKIELVFKSGQLSSVTPERAIYVEGGYCGANNMFTSQANGKAWADTQPHVRDPKVYQLDSALREFRRLLEEASSAN
jgi:hypothetical protein